MSIKRVDIYKDIFGQDEMSNLNSSISIPSYINTFSIAAELMRNWFLNGFPPGTIKSFHMVGKNPIIDYSKFDLKKSLQKEKPAAAMQLEPDLDWDRDKIDSYPWGLETYVNTNRLNNSFFKDEKRNLYLSLAIDEFKANVTYRILVPEKALQLDLRNYIKMKFRIGYTQEHWVDMDYHIPKNLITQLAIHAGYEIDEKGNVINNIDFMKYLNSHSVIPIVYKFRHITGQLEYFLKMKENYIHIGCYNPIDIDQGEQRGKTESKYIIQFEAELKMPAPKMYMYYSKERHNNITNFRSDSKGIPVGFCTIKMPEITDNNEKGWVNVLTTDCIEEDLSKPLVINIKELFEGSDTLKVIEYNSKMYISSSIFIDIKLFNDGYEVPYSINWNTFELTTERKLISQVTNICIYKDGSYEIEILRKLGLINNNRIG